RARPAASRGGARDGAARGGSGEPPAGRDRRAYRAGGRRSPVPGGRGPGRGRAAGGLPRAGDAAGDRRSEEHTSELQSHLKLVCRLLLEKKKQLRLHVLCFDVADLSQGGSSESCAFTLRHRSLVL